MSIQDLIELIKQQGVRTKIYPLAFPAKSPDEAMIVEVSQSFTSVGDVHNGTFTVTVRADHPERAEELSLDVNKRLKLLTDVDSGETQILMIKQLTPIPAYLGQGKGKEHYYMINFQVLFT